MTTPSVLDDELAELFVTASRALVGVAIRSIEASPVPVTVPQHRVLVLLAAEGAMTVGEIAHLAGVNQSNASRLCDRLQKLGLVERQRGSDDGRVVRVSLTQEGKRTVDAVTAVRRREVGQVLARLSIDDAHNMVSALVAFNDAAGERDHHTWKFSNT
jgi:DNA-binding MarR family transcriptional regulator